MIKKNCLYQRQKDNVRVVTLSTEPGGPPPTNFFGRSNHYWCTVRYVESGRKGYIRYDSLAGGGYDFLGHVNPAEIWKSSPLVTRKMPDYSDASAAAEHDLREREIVKKRKTIIDGHFYGKTVSQSAIGAMEQAIHMILAGV